MPAEIITSQCSRCGAVVKGDGRCPNYCDGETVTVAAPLRAGEPTWTEQDAEHLAHLAEDQSWIGEVATRAIAHIARLTGERAAATHGVTWVLIRGDCVLLERCEKKARVLGVGEWFVPGGKIEGDETPEDALRREIGEEWPDVQLSGWTPLPIVEGSPVPPGPRGLFLMRPFLITASGYYPDKSSEGTPLRWTPIAEALASPVLQVRMMVAAAMESRAAATTGEPNIRGESSTSSPSRAEESVMDKGPIDTTQICGASVLSPQVAALTGCPCTLVAPCSERCTCADASQSGGCQRCASYGSREQRVAAATRLAALTEERDAMQRRAESAEEDWLVATAAQASLSAALEAAKADTARIEWLEANGRALMCWNVSDDPAEDHWRAPMKPNNGWTVATLDDDDMDEYRGQTARDAIDWAMKSEALPTGDAPPSGPSLDNP